jgi:hypothetical protein
MPKIRGVHPDIWTDEDFVELSPFARLLWIGMWNYACDNGHLADRSKQIKMRVLPTDDVNCADLLRELEINGRIVRRDGWITIPNFSKRQKPDKRFWIICEAPGCAKPGDPERKPRSAHHEPPPSHHEPTPSALGDVDGEGDGEGEVKNKPCASADAERESEFDVWWAAYPRKRGKGQAAKAYRAARKRASAETLLAAVQQQTPTLTARGPDYCPYPATWLNGERWADQPDALMPQPQTRVQEHLSLVQQLAAEEADQTVREIGYRR